MVKIFVGGLDTNADSTNYITSDDLHKLFSDYKSLQRAERVDGKAFGFIHMKNRDEAEKAVFKLKGKTLKGQRISVECSPSKPCKFYVGKLSPNTTSADLRNLFEEEGAEVIECDVMSGKNFGFVHIETNSDKKIADNIIRALNGRKLKGNNIVVQFSETLKRGEFDEHDQFGGGQGPARGTPMFKNRPSPYPIANPLMMNQRGPGPMGPGPMGNMGMNRGFNNMDRMPHVMGGPMDRMPLDMGMDRMRHDMDGPMDRRSHDRGFSMDRNPMDRMSRGMNEPMSSGWMKKEPERYSNNDRDSKPPSLMSVDGVKPKSDLSQTIKDFQGTVNAANLLNLGQNLTNLVKSGRYVDTHIQCNGPTFKAHAIILCAKSSVFSEILETSDTLNVNYNAKVVNTLLQFMYSGKVTISDTDFNFLPAILAMADEFQISGTKDALTVALAKNLSHENAVETLQFAAEYGLIDLKHFATQYIVSNAGTIMKNTEAKNKLKQFPDIMFELVEALSIQNRGM